MLKVQKCFDDLLPVKITSTGLGLSQFFQDAAHRCGGSTGFVLSDDVRKAAESADAMLVSLGLPICSRVGAAYVHVERDDKALGPIKPLVAFHLHRTRDAWFLKKVFAGLAFPLEPSPIGLKLSASQRCEILATELRNLIPARN